MSQSVPVDPGQVGSVSSKPPTKAGRQRFKPQLSCTFCRHRKLKCDRNLPCENCLKRNQAQSCTYIHATLREKSSQVQKSGASSKDVQSQIKHLEDLVISLMNQTTSNNNLPPQGHPLQTTPESSPENYAVDEPIEQETNASLTGTAESFGRISIEDEKANFKGDEHWVAILDSIACLKDQLDNTEPQRSVPDPPSLPGPELLVGSVKAATRTEILAALPSRDIVDALVQAFFNTPDIGSSILHKPTFMREYHNFWLEPSKVPIIWIGFLYSLICLSAQFELLGAHLKAGTNIGFNLGSSGALRNPNDMVDVYREKTIQCLILSNYTDPGPYTVETMLLYYVSDHFRSADAQFGGWMVFGLIVRASMRLGLHRDASHYPSISLFKGEMQRRVWAAILHMDLQTSLQVGLPRMLKEGMYDTKQPGNYLDADFDEHTTVLPAERGQVESTAIGYSNTKHSITTVLGMIVDQANSVNPTTYEEVMKLDKLLHDVYDKSPEALKVRDLSDLAVGSPVVRVRKFAIDLTFQKAKAILHRKFFVKAPSSSNYQYPYSMKACVESAMRILDSQIYMHGETGLGRQLYGHRWKTSSLMLHDFLLAAMLVCLYLGNSISQDAVENVYPETEIKIKWSKEEMRTTIQGSLKIWEETSMSSKEARKASTALRAMLSQIDAADKARDTASASTSLQEVYAGRSPQPVPTRPSPSSDFSSTSWELTPPVPMSVDINDATIFAPLNAEPLDWSMWDEQFYTNRPVDPNIAMDLWNLDASAGVSFPDAGQGFMRWDGPP